MPTIDELRNAGFDDNEISEYVSTRSEEFRSAGFDDNEIGEYFGQPVQPAQPAQPVQPAQPDELLPFAQEGPQFQGLPPGASAPISAITGQPVPTSEEQFAGARAALNIAPYAFASAFRGVVPPALETAVMQPVTRAVTGRDYISPITTAQQVSGAQLPPGAQQAIGLPSELLGMSAPLSIAFKTSNAIMKAAGLPADLVIGNASIVERMAYGVMRGGTAGAIYGGLESPDKIEQDAAMFAALEAGLGASGAIVHKVLKSNWFRKLEIPERSLVVQTADDMLAAGHSEGKILRNLSDPDRRAKLFKQALAKRVTPEEPVAERLKKKLEVKPVAPKPVVPKPEPKPPVRPEPAKEPSVKPTVKPPVEPPSKPTEIPEFKSTQEAVKFGSTATPEQLEQVTKKIDEFRSTLKEARKIKDFDTAMIEAGKISIYDEAIRAKEILKEHPELFPDIKLPEPKPSVEPKTKPPVKPSIIPKFKNRPEAVAFAQTATPEQVAQMKVLRVEALAKSKKLQKAKDFQGAMDVTTEAQFLRESIENVPAKPPVKPSVKPPVKPSVHQKITEPLSAISTKTKNEYHKLLADRLIPILKDVDYVVIEAGVKVPGGVPQRMRISRGLWYKTKDRESIFVKGRSFKKGMGLGTPTILHESIHAATAKLIGEGNLVKNRGTELHKHVQDLYTLQGAVVKHLNNKVKDGTATRFEQRMTTQIGVSSAKELVAYGMTSKQFQKMLKDIPYEQVQGKGLTVLSKLKNMWSKFVDLVSKILGIKNNTALHELMRTSDEIITIKEKRIRKKDIEAKAKADIQAQRLPTPADIERIEKEVQALIKLTGKKLKARKDLKAIISKKAGLIKPDQEITVKERASLKDQIKLEAVAARKAFAAGKKEAAIKHKIKQLAIIERLKTKYEAKVEKIKTAKDILTNRRALITAIQKHFGLTDKDLRKITTRDIRLMSDLEFKQFKDKIKILAEKFEEKRTARQQLDFHIMDKEINVENLRKAMKLPTMRNMKISDIQKLDAALEPYQKGDEFLSVRKLETVDRTIFKGAKTWREIREKIAKKWGIRVKDLDKIKVSEFDRFRYDTALAERNPFYRVMVEETNALLLSRLKEYLDIEKETLKIGRKLKGAGFFIPQHKKIMKYMESTAKDKAAMGLTPIEIEFTEHMVKHYSDAMEYLIKIEAMNQGRQNYFTHLRRGILEAVKEDGIVAGVKELFEGYKYDEQTFNILDGKTGDVLAFDKFFQFAMRRTDKIKPTENVVKAFLVYMRLFKRKQALDEIVPLIDIYAHALAPKGLTETGILLHGNIVKFTKEWLNTKKGRYVDIGVKQGGKVDIALRLARMFTSLRDLALNLPVSVATEIGEQVTTYQLLGKVNYARGKIRQNTKQGKAIIEKYRNLIGKNPWKELVEPARDIGDRLMEGIFILFRDASVRANKTFLLGSLSKEEFKSGTISDERLSALRTELGRYRMVEGMESIIGATSPGKVQTQYKRWAIPILRTTIKNLGTIAKKITFQKPDSKEFKKSILELYRLVEISGFMLLTFGMIRDENDRSFTGLMIDKAAREATTLIQALKPTLFFSVGRVVNFAEELAQNLYMIAMLEKYKTKDEYKGVAGLKRQFKPTVVRHIEKGIKGEKKPGGGYYEPSVHKPEG